MVLPLQKPDETITTISTAEKPVLKDHKEPSLAERLREAWRGGSVTWKQAAVLGLSELIGTALLVSLACMGCLPGFKTGAPPVLQYSLSTGLVVMFVVQCFAHISGAHVNPAVTLCAVLFGGMSLAVAAVYVVAQIAGAILGYGLLLVVTPEEIFLNSTAFCVNLPHSSLSPVQAVLIEVICTTVLILLTCSVWDSRNKANTDSTAIKFGFTVAVLNMCASSFTGCSMNPVRSLGPVVWTNHWKSHWVYWVGPLLGSTITTLLYCAIFKKSEPTAIPREQEPLNQVQVKHNAVTA